MLLENWENPPPAIDNAQQVLAGLKSQPLLLMFGLELSNHAYGRIGKITFQNWLSNVTCIYVQGFSLSFFMYLVQLETGEGYARVVDHVVFILLHWI